MRYDAVFTKDKFFLILIFLSSISPAVSSFYPLVSKLENYFFLVSLFFGFVYFFRHILINKKLNAGVLFFLSYVLFSFLVSSINGVTYEKYVEVFLYEGKFMLLALSVFYWKKTNDNLFLIGLGYMAIFQFSFSLLEIIDLYGFKEKLVALTFSSADGYYVENVIGGGVFGTMMSKNMLGYFFVFVFISYYYLTDLEKRFFRFVLILCFLGVILSQSRTALIFLTAFIFLRVLKTKARFVFFYFTPLFLVILFLSLGDYFPNSFSEIFTAKYYENVFNVGRGAYIAASTLLFLDNPFGVGAGGWGLGLAFDADLLHNQIIYYESFQIPLGVFQDNNWISILTQFGFISFFSFFLFWKYIIFSSCAKKTRTKEFIAVLFLLLLYCGFFIAGFTTKVLMYIFIYFVSRGERTREDIART